MTKLPLFVLSAIGALHAQSVVTNLRFQKSQFDAYEPLTMTFEVRNTSASTVSFCTWNTPLGTIAGDVFAVDGPSGRAAYAGPLIKRAPINAADYILLAPGETRTATIDLSKYYKLPDAGGYAAKYVPGGARVSVAPKMLHPIDVGTESPTATFQLPAGKVVAQPAAPAAKTTADATCSNCSSTRLTSLRSAFKAALAMATKAADSLVQTPLSKRSAAIRSKTFFGSYDFTRYRTATNTMQNVLRALRDENVVFEDVSGNSSHQCQTAYACVWPNDPYRVFLGTGFWGAPEIGEDSKAGTLIHELSHFTVLGGTSDHNGTYGIAACKSMATNTPANAVNHADCIEYFAENPSNYTQSTDGRVRTDFNDDGKADIRFFEPGNLTTYVSNSNGTNGFAYAGAWTTSNGFGWNKAQFYQGDFNGDGLTDLGYFETSNNTFHVATSTGSAFGGPGTGAWTIANSFGSSTGRFLVGDFNGDRRSDLAYFDPATSTVRISTSTGTAFNGPRSGQWVGPSHFGWQAANYFVGDFDGDRLSDLGYAENNNTFHVNLSNGTGLFATGSGQWVAPNSFGHVNGRYYIGDYNGDGRSDLGFFEPGDYTFHVSLSQGMAFFGAGSGRWASTKLLGLDKTRFMVGDVTGDGKDDLLYQETSNNTVKVAPSSGALFPSASVWIPSNGFGHSGGNYGIGQSN